MGVGGAEEGQTIPTDTHAALELKDVKQLCKGILSKTYQVSFWLKTVLECKDHGLANDQEHEEIHDRTADSPVGLYRLY